MDAVMSGTVMTDLPRHALAEALRRAGIPAQVRQSSHYADGEYVRAGGESGVYCSLERASPSEYLVRGDAEGVEALETYARALSAALAGLGVRHRLELYDEEGALAAYVHHQWPRDS